MGIHPRRGARRNRDRGVVALGPTAHVGLSQDARTVFVPEPFANGLLTKFPETSPICDWIMPLLKGLRHGNRKRTFSLGNHRQPPVPNSTQAAEIRFASRWHEGVRLGRLPGEPNKRSPGQVSHLGWRWRTVGRFACLSWRSTRRWVLWVSLSGPQAKLAAPLIPCPTSLPPARVPETGQCHRSSLPPWAQREAEPREMSVPG